MHCYNGMGRPHLVACGHLRAHGPKAEQEPAAVLGSEADVCPACEPSRKCWRHRVLAHSLGCPAVSALPQIGTVLLLCPAQGKTGGLLTAAECLRPGSHKAHRAL